MWEESIETTANIRCMCMVGGGMMGAVTAEWMRLDEAHRLSLAGGGVKSDELPR